MQHQYHTKIDDLIEKTSASMSQGMISKLIAVLEATLSKMSRYDEGSLIGSILSFTVGIWFLFFKNKDCCIEFLGLEAWLRSPMFNFIE